MNRVWRKRTAEDSGDDSLRILKKIQKGLTEGKWYEMVLSEGYVDGEYRTDIDVEAHSQTPDEPSASLTIIYDYFRFDYSKDDHNLAVDLDQSPATVESDQKYLVLVHEHDLLYRGGEAVLKPGEEDDMMDDETMPFLEEEQEDLSLEEEEPIEEVPLDEEGEGSQVPSGGPAAPEDKLLE